MAGFDSSKFISVYNMAISVLNVFFAVFVLQVPLCPHSVYRQQSLAASRSFRWSSQWIVLYKEKTLLNNISLITAEIWRNDIRFLKDNIIQCSDIFKNICGY